MGLFPHISMATMTTLNWPRSWISVWSKKLLPGTSILHSIFIFILENEWFRYMNFVFCFSFLNWKTIGRLGTRIFEGYLHKKKQVFLVKITTKLSFIYKFTLKVEFRKLVWLLVLQKVQIDTWKIARISPFYLFYEKFNLFIFFFFILIFSFSQFKSHVICLFWKMFPVMLN